MIEAPRKFGRKKLGTKKEISGGIPRDPTKELRIERVKTL